MRITDKAAIVTGGAQGIGLAIAETFLEAEARVLIADRNEEALHGVLERLQERFGRKVRVLAADVSSEEDVRRMVGDTLDAYGTVDILVNNAGFGGMKYFWELPADEWDAVIDTNLKEAFLCSKEVVKVMLERGVKGRIINIASTNSILPSTGLAAYCSSKGGLLMFTRVAALELGPHGINVNAIGPGTTITPVTEWFYNLPVLREGFLDRTPKGRFGRPEDIAKVALFLASDYSEWITGQIIYVDGGQSLLGLPRYLEGFVRSTSGSDVV
jgi:3-oxoacyl-[acyl-carrier protein] reductase